MTEIKTHKFDAKLDITYTQFIRDSMAGEVSLQRELERVLGKEQAHAILRDWAIKRTSETLREFLNDTGIEIRSFEDFKKYMAKMWDSASVSNTHTCETVDSKSNQVTYKVTECIWAKAMRELDAADLGQLTMCDIDFVSAGIYHPNISLVREKTLMNGDDYCDFTYVWNEK